MTAGDCGESFIGAVEYTVAILGEQVLPVIKIEPANEFYDYEAKYLPRRHAATVPCGPGRGAGSRDAALAKQAFALIGGKAGGG